MMPPIVSTKNDQHTVGRGGGVRRGVGVRGEGERTREEQERTLSLLLISPRQPSHQDSGMLDDTRVIKWWCQPAEVKGQTIYTHVHAHMHLCGVWVTQCAHMRLCGLHEVEGVQVLIENYKSRSI